MVGSTPSSFYIPRQMPVIHHTAIRCCGAAMFVRVCALRCFSEISLQRVGWFGTGRSHRTLLWTVGFVTASCVTMRMPPVSACERANATPCPSHTRPARGTKSVSALQASAALSPSLVSASCIPRRCLALVSMRPRLPSQAPARRFRQLAERLPDSARRAHAERIRRSGRWRPDCPGRSVEAFMEMLASLVL